MAETEPGLSVSETCRFLVPVDETGQCVSRDCEYVSDTHLVVSHVVVTAIMLSALCDSLQLHAGGRSQSTPPQRALSRSAAAATSAAPSRDTYAFVRGNVRSDV